MKTGIWLWVCVGLGAGVAGCNCGSGGPGGGEQASSGNPGGTGGGDGGLASSGGSSGASSSSSSGGSSGASSSGMASSGSSGGASSSSGMAGTTLTLTAPANDGTTVTLPLLINTNVTFEASIATTGTLAAANVSWTLTAPDATSTTSGGTLTGNLASLAALLDQEGNYTVAVTYDDGTQPLPGAQLVVPVYSNLPPQLAWVAPANDGSTVTGPRRLGTALNMVASLADDDPLLPQNVTWTHTPPGGMALTSQGMFMAGAGGRATLSYTADLTAEGTHTVEVSYSDGTHTRALSLDVVVLANLPPVVTVTAPAHDGVQVTVPVAVGDALVFNVSIADDTPILPQNSLFEVRDPANAATTNQGTVNAAGNNGTATLSIPFASAGNWTVTYSYTDAGGAVGQAVLTVPVAQDPAPAVAITAPAHNATTLANGVAANGPVSFVGTATDNTTIAAQNILWTYTPATGVAQTSQGTITGTGTIVTTSFTVADVGGAGTGSIRLSYTDASGSVGQVTLSVPVLPAGTPTVAITNPAADGAQVRVNAVVNFTAALTDNAPIVASNLTWTLTSPGGASQTSPGGFTAGGAAGTGTATFSAALTAAGNWSVALRYVDADNLSASATRSVAAAANATPTCTFEPLAACVGTGTYTVTVTLADADGDTPISAVLASSNASDMFSTQQLTSANGGRRTFQITFNTTGSRTLSCTATDATSAVGVPGTLTVPVVTAPVVALVSPMDNALLASGANMDFSVTATADPAAQPAMLEVVDSVEGPQTVTANAGSITAPLLGFHDLTATLADACANTDAMSVRYAVTPGGGPASLLGQDTTGLGNVQGLATLGTSLLVGTSNGSRQFDPAGAGASAFPGAGSMGIGNLGTTSVRDVATGPGDAGGSFSTAFATGNGAFFCATVAGVTACTQITENQGNLRNNDVRAVAVLGQGAGPGSVVLVGGPDGLQMYDHTRQLLRTIQEGNGNDEILGTIQDIQAADPANLGLDPVSFWVATDRGVARVTMAGSAVTQIQHFDENRTNNLLPDYNVRALVVDAGDIESQWFATAGGLGHHQGPAVDGATWTSMTRNSVGLPSNDLQSIALDRHPSASQPILWVGTRNAGAFRLNPATVSAPLITRITQADGLPADRVNAITILSTDVDHIKWMGTTSGLWGYRGL